MCVQRTGCQPNSRPEEPVDQRLGTSGTAVLASTFLISYELNLHPQFSTSFRARQRSEPGPFPRRAGRPLGDALCARRPCPGCRLCGESRGERPSPSQSQGASSHPDIWNGSERSSSTDESSLPCPSSRGCTPSGPWNSSWFAVWPTACVLRSVCGSIPESTSQANTLSWLEINAEKPTVVPT